MKLEPNNKTSYLILLGLVVVMYLLMAVIFDFTYQVYTDIEATMPSSYDMERLPGRSRDSTVTGVASYYDYVLPSGWSSVGSYVCATRDFERYSYVIAEDLDTGRKVRCKVTDYGPDQAIHPDRIVDLSTTAFQELRPLSAGLVKNVAVYYEEK